MLRPRLLFPKLGLVAILGVDVGGTFTDAVLLDEDRLATAKVPTERDQAESVLAAARAVGTAGLERFTHGTTIATNALLERTGARTALVATEGFEHVLHLRRQARAHLYRLCEPHPEPLVPLERCFGVRERVGPDGVLVDLDLGSLPEIDAEAVAVCLLFSFRDPRHERAGAVGAARICALAGFEDAVSFDMGGTSTDVCLVTGGAAGRAAEKTVAGLPIRLPTVDLHTVGAGGGSIAWVDAGGALRVGPRSAGAHPGPACYGRGGEEPGRGGGGGGGAGAARGAPAGGAAAGGGAGGRRAAGRHLLDHPRVGG